MMPDAFPLAWPLSRPRTPADERESARFHSRGHRGASRPVTVAEGTRRVLVALDAYTRVGQNYRVPHETIVISSNVELRLDGLPRSGRREPDDPGVAVYYALDGVAICLPCDTWDTVGGNLAAVAAHVEALRGIERWGVGTTADHYAGFLALPAPGQTSGRAWWEVLGVEPTASEAAVKRAYHAAAAVAHPDNPHTGSRAAWDEVAEAYRQGLAATRG